MSAMMSSGRCFSTWIDPRAPRARETKRRALKDELLLPPPTDAPPPPRNFAASRRQDDAGSNRAIVVVNPIAALSQRRVRGGGLGRGCGPARSKEFGGQPPPPQLHLPPGRASLPLCVSIGAASAQSNVKGGEPYLAIVRAAEAWRLAWRASGSKSPAGNREDKRRRQERERLLSDPTGKGERDVRVAGGGHRRGEWLRDDRESAPGV